jgi:hypothetical protein
MEDHASSLVDILFFDADHGFVVGGKTEDPSPGHEDLTPVVLETTDGGDTWVNRVADLEFPVGDGDGSSNSSTTTSDSSRWKASITAQSLKA